MTNANQITIAVIAMLAIFVPLIVYHTWPERVLTAQERCVQQHSRVDNLFNGFVLTLCKHAKD